VIALGHGGALEIVENGCGLLYQEPTEASLDDVLRRFDRAAEFFKPQRLQVRAEVFSEATFERGFRAVLHRYGLDESEPFGSSPVKRSEADAGLKVTG